MLSHVSGTDTHLLSWHFAEILPTDYCPQCVNKTDSITALVRMVFAFARHLETTVNLHDQSKDMMSFIMGSNKLGQETKSSRFECLET